MSKQADKESVFLTTKVRTKLKGDGSWLQQRNEAQGETNEEKPWLAEVRAGRLNGEPVETSPASSPTTSTPPDVKADAERTPASGFLIRGVFTKLESPTLSSTSNGVSQTATQFPKKPSESYKKIAPYTVRPTAGNQEAQLSSEEQEKRTEAASSVLMKSAVRQRSYVLSAAKKYETQDMAPETSLANSSPAFVARRVETVDDDDDESAATPAPASNPPTSPAAPVTSVAAAAPEPKPASVADAAPAALKVVKPAPGPVKDAPPPGPVAVKDPFEDTQPGCTKVAAPAPVLIPECFQAVPTQPEAKASAFSGRVNTPLVDLAPAAPSPASSTPAAPVPSTPVPLTPAPVSPVKTEAKPEFVPKPAPQLRTQESAATPAPASNPPTSPAPPVTSVAVAAAAPEPKPAAPAPVLMPECFQAVPTQPEAKASAFSGRVNTPLVDLAPAAPSPASPTPAAPVPSTPVPRTPAPVSPVKTEAKPEFVPKPAPQLSSGVDTLTNLSNTLITFNSSSTSFVDDAPVLAEEEAGSANSHTTENGDEEEADPELGSREPLTDDLLAFTDGPEESRAEPVPPSPGRWSQDLLKSELNSESKKKTSGPLDLLANDVIPINPEARRLNVQRKEEKRTDETAGDTQSLTETVTITTKTVIITDKSSADPFDPYPIGTTSSNSSSDLLQPESDVSNNSHVLDSHSDLISINTDATSQRTWARTWQTSPPQQENNEESQEALPAAQMLDEETLVRFERKSAENDSPWDRWTSPTVYTLPVTTGEEEEEEEEAESTEYKQTETVTTITTIRERLSEEQPVVDRYETYSRSVTEEDQRVLTPEPEAKRGFVYLKEYVNATELSLHNARDTPDSGSDYVTSSSTSYSYNSPSTYSSGLASSTCNFCGEQVGNDAKITIEHLNINCHPRCFQCGVCKKPMGDLLDSMFLHGGKVHCESCYSEALD
uniref:Zinc finger protein 185 with LIM domain n=1 Tax=Gasterosteus aculeatus aculeatus TaxID=481459 RepID=G3Q2S0_GASAC|nr:zinc finger protein 185 isoform X2 [Gasterosteus aculeatus aculeatus]